jgi:hypothetical protein
LETTIDLSHTKKYRNKNMQLFLSLLLLLGATEAFVSQTNNRVATNTALEMAPRFDKKTQKWYPTKPEEGPEAGYPITRTLLLHGPKPFLQRVFNKDDYEQAVLKFMAGDKCDRDEAQVCYTIYLPVISVNIYQLETIFKLTLCLTFCLFEG